MYKIYGNDMTALVNPGEVPNQLSVRGRDFAEERQKKQLVKINKRLQGVEDPTNIYRSHISLSPRSKFHGGGARVDMMPTLNDHSPKNSDNTKHKPATVAHSIVSGSQISGRQELYNHLS